jgi:hypothetical protein
MNTTRPYIPGEYEVLLSMGDVDAYDIETIELLVWHSPSGKVLRLTASGCVCCGDASDVPYSEGEPAELEKVADELWSLWDERYAGPDAAELAVEIEDGLRKARALLLGEVATRG